MTSPDTGQCQRWRVKGKKFSSRGITANHMADENIHSLDDIVCRAGRPYPTLKPRSHHRILNALQSTLAGLNLGNSSLHPTQEDALPVRQVIHGVQGNVESPSGVVDGEDEDGPAVVRCRPACPALIESSVTTSRYDNRALGRRMAYIGRVPATNGFDAADVGELLDFALLGPAVLGG